MGYTHYWTREQNEIPPRLWKKYTKRLIPILEHYPDLLSDVEVSDEVVFFDGCHETYADTPMDFADATLVLLATITWGDPCGFSWSSDGSEAEHSEGITLANCGPAPSLATG